MRKRKSPTVAKLSLEAREMEKRKEFKVKYLSGQVQYNEYGYDCLPSCLWSKSLIRSLSHKRGGSRIGEQTSEEEPGPAKDHTRLELN